MRKFFNKSDEKGTLLVEALAMLGLIAMVTPTLYKKSAERLQEIQDINAASQVRIMNSVVETFVKNNFSKLKDAVSSDTHGTVELAYDDNTPGAFEVGYSSFLPYGYTPNELRNYGAPKIYVHEDEDKLITYLVYPHILDPGKKRASRLASLVGANGGIITDKKEAQGTGGAWYLDSTMVGEVNIDDSVLTPNSLIVTSDGAIDNTSDISDIYLYRVPTDETSKHRNTMVTDLYMGDGHSDLEELNDTGFTEESKLSHGIFNVRKLTLNTNCNFRMLEGSEPMASTCVPDVADLYIGKPELSNNPKYSTSVENEGAAWIYGNLSALNEGFQIWGNGSTKTEMKFRPSDANSTATYEILYASGDMNSTDVDVKMVGNFAHASKDGTNLSFKINSSMTADESDDSPLFNAEIQGAQPVVQVASGKGSYVYVARKGGEVYINSEKNDASAMVHAKTVINSGGGDLFAGSQDGAWLAASGRNNSARVEIMKDGGNYFVVGNGIGAGTAGADTNNTLANTSKVYVDFGTTAGSSSEVSLYGRRVKILEGNVYQLTSTTGGIAGASGVTNAQQGLTALTTQYTDIFGSIYMGNEAISSSDTGGKFYNRGDYVLGVAGNAWIDKTLWARDAWFNDAGFRNFHAGFRHSSSYINGNRNLGWMNVYAPGSAHFTQGAVVVKNPNKSTSDYGNEADIMFIASSGVAGISDTEGAWARFEHGSARVGTEYNYFEATKSGPTVSGSSFVVGGNEVGIYTKNLDNSASVNLQDGALQLYGHASQTGNHENIIVAKTGEYAVMLGSTAAGGVEDANIYANENIARTRYINFEVQRDDSGRNSSRVFGVYPNANANGSANVEVYGSFHVTGNEVMHVASDEYNTAARDSTRAMFEVDPSYVRVWAKDRATGNYGDGGSDYYAMLSINPEDVGGSSVTSATLDDTSIYIRKGAIELEPSYGSNGENASSYEADEGYGYIKANRLVSNAGMVAKDGLTTEAESYDQYMVNPAYTSVMHDIKLTTRGGARLSDILPDFVLKGVYNISNDYVEGSKKKRIRWSAGDACSRGNVECLPSSVEVAWADPYVGIIPYAMCPPGYKNMATMMPISFQIGRTGQMVKASNNGGVSTGAKWMLAEPVRQTEILAKALQEGNIMYPSMQETKSLYWNEIYQSSDTFSQFVATNTWKTEGWFWGLKAEHDKFGYLSSKVQFGDVDVYKDSNNSSYAVAEPFYFQEGTFLKTSLSSEEGGGKGWEGRIGFLYDFDQYEALNTRKDRVGIRSNNTDGEGNETDLAYIGDYFWNAFPVATNTLEGHATVYCYFDRSQFDGTNVLQFDPLSDNYDHKNKVNPAATSSDAYVKRLDDPTLKYNNPW